jgi:hypothetical protein
MIIELKKPLEWVLNFQPSFAIMVFKGSSKSATLFFVPIPASIQPSPLENGQYFTTLLQTLATYK